MVSKIETVIRNLCWSVASFVLFFGFQNCTNPLRFSGTPDGDSSSSSMNVTSSPGDSGGPGSLAPIVHPVPIDDSKGTSSLSYNALEITYEDKTSFNVDRPCRVYTLVLFPNGERGWYDIQSPNYQKYMRYDTSQFLLSQPALTGLTGSKTKLCITGTPYHFYTLTKMKTSNANSGEYTDTSGISWQSTRDIVRSTAYFFKADPEHATTDFGAVAEMIALFMFPIGSPSSGSDLVLIASSNGPISYLSAGDQRQLEKTIVYSNQGTQILWREIGRFNNQNEESISLENIPAGTYRLDFRMDQVNFNKVAASHSLYGVTYITVK